MRRMFRATMAAVLAVMLLSTLSATVWAQTPTPTPTPTSTPTPGPGQGHRFGPGPFRQSPPSGGVGLMVMDRDQDREQLMLHLRLQECEPQVLAVTIGGRWRIFSPGAPAWVTPDFPTQFRAGDPFYVACAGTRPDVVLGDSDDGTTATVAVGDRIRIVLESNASTGYSWTVAAAPNGILEPVGTPFYVPAASDLLGAPGYQVFEYRAVSAGSTSVTLNYVRPGTTDPAADTWSVNVTVN